MVDRDDVLRAAEVVRGRVHRTPMLSFRTLGPDVALKAELLQRTGSFKPRGVLNRLAGLSADDRRRGVIGVSAGNHAQALAWGAAQEGLSALVVMWQGASAAKVAAARAYGAEIDLGATGPEDAFERLAEVQQATGRVLVHPFDDPLVVAGAGTTGLEVLEDAPGVETVVVPVGGGGLLAGVVAACAPAGVRVVAVEPEGSDALRRGLEAGEPVWMVPRTIADGLAAPYAGRIAIDLCRTHGVEVVLVSEEEIREGMRLLYGRAKLACEPAGAAAVAAVMSGKVDGRGRVCVVSGGNVEAETASAILAGR